MKTQVAIFIIANPYYYAGTYYVSAIEPMLYRSTIDSPLTRAGELPTRQL
jgi:hypothetical protein